MPSREAPTESTSLIIVACSPSLLRHAWPPPRLCYNNHVYYAEQ